MTEEVKVKDRSYIVCLSLFGTIVAGLLRSKNPSISDEIIEIGDEAGLAPLDSIQEYSNINIVVRLYDKYDFPFYGIQATLLAKSIEHILSGNCQISRIYTAGTYLAEGRKANDIAKEKLALCKEHCPDVCKVGGDGTVQERFGIGEHNVKDVNQRDAEDVCTMLISLN
jgi:hypothetical protein